MEYDEETVPFYEKPEWSDVVPIPQDDGPNPLVPIAYTKEYSTTMDYFRAITRAQEQSERALELTEIVIGLSPSHYTVWHYRQNLLKALNKDLNKELEWVQSMIDDHPKSYQIWHHRQVIVEHNSIQLLPHPSDDSTSLAEASTSDATTTFTIPYQVLSENLKQTVRDTVRLELEVIAQALSEDSKNHHAWSYRQWVLSHFGPGPWWEEELEYIDELLTVDVRNNSAWNQRFFVISQGPSVLNKDIVDREVTYAKKKIERTPSNESPWAYLAGVLNKAKRPLPEIKDFCEDLLALPRANFSPHLHSTLLDIYEQEAKEQKNVESLEKAKEEAVMLAEKVDTIRSKYWNWRKSQLKSVVLEA